MTKTTKRTKAAGKPATAGKPSGAALTEAQLDKATGGMLACRNPTPPGN